MSYGIVRRFLAQDVEAGIERFANVVAQRSSDERRIQRRLYILQSFTLAVQRQEELKLGLQYPPSPTEYSSFPIDPYPPSLGISTEYFSTDRLKTVDQLRQLKVTRSIRAHMKLICGFGFSPDGSYLTTASTDQTVVIIPLLVSTIVYITSKLNPNQQ
jgi:WD40 repeat protein